MATTILDKDRDGHRGDVEGGASFPPTFDEEPKTLGGVEPEEYPFPLLSQPTGPEEASHKDIAATEDLGAAFASKETRAFDATRTDQRSIGDLEDSGIDKQDMSYPAQGIAEEKAVYDHAPKGLGFEADVYDHHTSYDGQDAEIHVAPAIMREPSVDIHDPPLASTSRGVGISEKSSPPGRLPVLPQGVERAKRRDHPVSTPEFQPEEKRMHLDEAFAEKSTTHHESAFIPQPHVPEIRTDFGVATAHPHQESTPAVPAPASSRGHSPVFEPTWSFGGVRDSAVHVADSPLLTTAPPFTQTNVRDSGYHDTLSIPQGPSEPAEGAQTKKKRRSQEEEHRSIAEVEHDDSKETQRRARSPSLPDVSTLVGITSPSAIESATKDRTSYLFNSSPSTRAYDSPSVSTKGRHSEVVPLGTTKEHASDKSESHSPSLKKHDESPSRTATTRSAEHGSPTRQRKEPYKSIFGDPSEKPSDSSVLTTPSTKNIRTPSSQLGTIKEFSSPDDSPLHKKGRAISDVGAPDRGVKAPRRSASPKPIVERLKSPPPQTPTPSKRRHAGPSIDTSAHKTPSRDSPWHQVHESVDRSMALSPARRLRSPQTPASDPVKQRFGEQRSPSVMSDRSVGSITRHKTPDHLRPLSATSNRSATPPLRRVDRSASGDLRAASRLGEVKARDAKNAQPDLASIALAAGATAAIAGIASSSKYDPVKDKGKGRADMPDVYVSFRPCATPN